MREQRTNISTQPVGLFLAAGASSRMGRSKQNLPFGASYLASQALSQALDSRLERIVVVVRRSDEDFLASFEKERIEGRLEIALCEDAHLGQSASLKCGLQKIKPEENAFLILLADQPFVTSSMIDTLIQTYAERQREDEIQFAAYRFNDVARPPAILSVSLLPALEKLKGDKGARAIIGPNSPYNGIYLNWDDPLAFADIDTWDDYMQAVSHLDRRGNENA